MKKNKIWTSIAEAMVVMLIILIWVVWMYNIYISSVRLENSINNKIQAIAIAREGIEAFTNIRDTNWLLFSSNHKNCWNTFSYENKDCVSDNSTIYDIKNNSSFKIFQNQKNRWQLSQVFPSEFNYLNGDYKNKFKVWLDSKWFYTQSWIIQNIKPFYTREIIVKYIEDTNWIDWINSNDEKMEVTSLVQWMDKNTSKIHKVKLKTILTNRKN